MKKIILFDIDFTLSNRDYLKSFGREYLSLLTNKSINELNPIIDSIIKTSWERLGIFDIYFYAKKISEEFKSSKLEKQIIDMFIIDYPYEKAIYPEAIEALNKLKNKYILGVQTDGQEIFQLKKIESVIKYFDKKYIFIFKDKMEEIFDKIKGIEHNVIILDDKPEYINKLVKKGIKAILIERGRWAEDYTKSPKKYPNINESVSNLNDLVL
jgi:FMN phosphatase YigB (HAD superfamily)